MFFPMWLRLYLSVLDADMTLGLLLLTISFLNQFIFFPGDNVFVFPYGRRYDVETLITYTGTAGYHGMIPWLRNICKAENTCKLISHIDT